MRDPIAAPRSAKPLDLLARLGARVRALRTARAMSRAQLAARSGVSMRFLAQLEAEAANISLLRLQEVAQALDVDIGALLAADEHSRVSAGEHDTVTRDLAAFLSGRSAEELAEVRSWLAARFAVARGPSIALLGLRGAGKSTVGKRLARRFRVPFFELDALIEQAAGLPLEQIFELQGEAYYRRLEREALVRFLATTHAAVLATGGGLVTDAETFTLLRDNCTTVWLQAVPEQHWQRVVRQGDRRPMRGHPGAMQELRALLAARGPLYAQAHLRVDTTGRSVASVADELVMRLGGTQSIRRRPPRAAARRRRDAV